MFFLAFSFFNSFSLNNFFSLSFFILYTMCIFYYNIMPQKILQIFTKMTKPNLLKRGRHVYKYLFSSQDLHYFDIYLKEFFFFLLFRIFFLSCILICYFRCGLKEVIYTFLFCGSVWFQFKDGHVKTVDFFCILKKCFFFLLLEFFQLKKKWK